VDAQSLYLPVNQQFAGACLSILCCTFPPVFLESLLNRLSGLPDIHPVVAFFLEEDGINATLLLARVLSQAFS